MKTESVPAISIAVVSGKGGSGKTMLAATLARLLDDAGKQVLLVDADFATAGLTYYMGLNEVENISTGLTGLLPNASSAPHDFDVLTQRLKSFKKSGFIGVGDHRRYLKAGNKNSAAIREAIGNLLSSAGESGFTTIIDCRGGIDEESLEVCAAVSLILIVAETDTTSFQSTQHLVDVLYDNNLSGKLRGFFINKVFDDPGSIARNGTSAFRTQFLSAIPFDLDATRSFLVGNIPRLGTLFVRQVQQGALKAGLDVAPSPGAALRFDDFRGLTLRDKDVAIGSVVISFASIVAVATLIYARFGGLHVDMDTLLLTIGGLALLGASESTRKLLGRLLRLCIELASKTTSPSK